MTLKTDIQRASSIIRQATSWLCEDAAKGGFAMNGSESELNLAEAEFALRVLADSIANVRKELVENTPPEFERLRIVR